MKIVILGYLADIEEWIWQGWYVSEILPHPVMMAYDRVYYWRYV